MLFYYVSMIESGEDQRKFARLYENYKNLYSQEGQCVVE